MTTKFIGKQIFTNSAILVLLINIFGLERKFIWDKYIQYKLFNKLHKTRLIVSLFILKYALELKGVHQRFCAENNANLV
jgi:hypothetical protein